jgi:hypothetical protein
MFPRESQLAPALQNAGQERETPHPDFRSVQRCHIAEQIVNGKKSLTTQSRISDTLCGQLATTI